MGFIDSKKRLTCWLCFKSIRMSDRQSSVTHPIMSVSGSRISWSQQWHRQQTQWQHQGCPDSSVNITKTRQHSRDCHHHGDSKDWAHWGAAQWSAEHGEDRQIIIVFIILKIAWLIYSHGHCSYCRSILTQGPTPNSIITGLVHSRPLSLTLVLPAPHCSQCYKGCAANKWWIHPILLFRPRQDDDLNKKHKHTTLSQIWHTTYFHFRSPHIMRCWVKGK